MKKNRMNLIGMGILIVLFILFYVLTTYFLDKKVDTNTVDKEVNNEVVQVNDNDANIAIVTNLYNSARIIYDVVNTQFKLDLEDNFLDDEVIYKKITNFDLVMDDIFTANGKKDYLETLNSYFKVVDDNVYLAGNLVSYQTYYFRGDDTNIYIVDAGADKIKAIIYEKWTSNNTNTLALIDVLKVSDNWFIDNIDILSIK